MRKRILSCILVLCLVFSLLPVGAFADTGKAASDSAVDVSGTTSVGKMISNEISAQKAETSQDESNISDLIVEDDIAMVTFMTNASECDIVVGIYDENDGTKMLASGTATAFSGDGKVTVDLVGEIPEAFVATAYMLESTSHSPLCKAYTTQMYTTEMQAFLATTVSDYDEDLVLNLDESEETNFAVFNTDTLRADESGGMSVEDKGDGTYIVTNADADVKSLAKGDEFAFTYDDGTVLLVSVATVNVDGDTVTITEATDAELQDFFDYVKIEGTNDSDSQATIDTSVADEGVTLVEEQPAVQFRARAKAIDKEGSYGRSFSVSLKNDKVKGSLTLGYEVSLKVYIKSSYKFVMLKVDFTQSLSATFTAFKGEKSLNLPSVDVYIMAGVYAHLKPSFVCEASVSVKWTGSVKTTIGISYDSDYGFDDKSSSPSCDSKLELSGKIFVGIKVSLNIDFVSDKIASAGLEAKAGAELSEKERLDQASSGSKKHECEKCIEGKITFVKSLTGKVKFIKFEVERTFAEKKWKLSDYYNSITFGDSGKGTCPHISYRLTAAVLDQDGNKVANASIECSKLSNCPLTDSNGVATFYLPNGEYNLNVKSGTQSASKKITIHNNEKIVIINLSTGSQVPDEPQISDSGKCGDDLIWTLDNNGTLTISGEGAMSGYSWQKNTDGKWTTTAPWGKYYKSIKSVEIENGVTSIGGGAFFSCNSLASVMIPNSVREIDECAFKYCSSLTSVTIPDGVTSIGVSAFSGCSSLTSVTIPDSVTSIGAAAFCDCSSLVRVIIPNSVTNIGYDAFLHCTSLTSVTIGDSVTSIEESAFCDCSSLTSVTIPKGVTRIDDWAFSSCSSLTSVTIPDGVTSIGEGAFSDCSNLKSVTIPNSVTSISERAFTGCSSLTSVTIPDSVTSIGGRAFLGCSSLTSVTIPNAVTSIGGAAFEGCSSLTSVTIPDTVTSIDNYAFSGCSNLTSVAMSDSVTNIGWGAFYRCGALTDVYYNGTKAQWNNIYIDNYNECLINANIHFNGDGDEDVPWSSFSNLEQYSAAKAKTAPVEKQGKKSAAFSAKKTKAVEAGVKTRSFTGLKPEAEYVFIVVRDPKAEDYFASGNLCYIAQKQSDASGSVSFAYYSAAESVSESVYVLHVHSYADGACTICGIVDPNYEPPHEHSFGAWKQIKAPTCTAKGTESRTCSCGETETREIAATGHHYTDTVTAPTCTAKGYTTHTCACGNSYADNYTNALGHSYKNGICTRCNAKSPSYVAAPVIKITTSAGKPKISWSKVDGATKYYVYRSTDGKKYSLLVTTAKTSVTNTKATIGTTYYYKVKAAKVVNDKTVKSVYSNVKSIKCTPAAPVVSISRSNGKPKLTWKAVTGASKYYIYRSTDGKTYKQYTTTTKTTYTNTGAASGKKYYYKVKAVAVVNKKNVFSAYSTAKNLMTTIAAPTVSITTANGKPKITWKAVTGADKYIVYRSTDGKTFKQLSTTTKTSLTNTGAKKNTKYYYKVKAVCTKNTSANSALSKAVSIKATK